LRNGSFHTNNIDIELNRLLMNVIEGVNLCYIHDENKFTKCKRRAWIDCR